MRSQWHRFLFSVHHIEGWLHCMDHICPRSSSFLPNSARNNGLMTSHTISRYSMSEHFRLQGWNIVFWQVFILLHFVKWTIQQQVEVSHQKLCVHLIRWLLVKFRVKIFTQRSQITTVFFLKTWLLSFSNWDQSPTWTDPGRSCELALAWPLWRNDYTHQA